MSLSASPALKFHPHHGTLMAEAHARPSVDLPCPAMVSRITCLLEEPEERDAARTHIEALCNRFMLPLPPAESRRHFVDAGSWSMVWEGHTEFVSYTFYQTETADPGFVRNALSSVPADWLADIPGKVIAAAHIALLTVKRETSGIERQAREAFGSSEIVLTRTSGGFATVATDFRSGPDGFLRILVSDHGMKDSHRGRLAQRLLEIDAYRMAALLGLPEARSAMARLQNLEERMEAITARIVAIGAKGTSDRDLLAELSEIAGETEELGARTSFRFEASRAYYAIVTDRIERLREEVIDGHQRLTAFMQQRLAPAMRTCDSVRSRREALATEVSRAIQLLATRVEIAVSEQNARLLTSLDQRSELQLRLQETVEGLSVVAITYYAAGLVSYVAKAAEDAGMALSPTLLTAGSVPVIAFLAWMGLKRMRQRLGMEASRAGHRR